MNVLRHFEGGPYDGQERAVSETTLGVWIPTGTGTWDRYALHGQQMVWQGLYRFPCDGLGTDGPPRQEKPA